VKTALTYQNIIRVLSKKGICSRKQAVVLVKQGRIQINKKVISNPGHPVTSSDIILLDNKPLEKSKKTYILFNKPKGFVTTRNDELGRKTVYDLLGDIGRWVFPVGRLDKDSEGLLIFTNDTIFGDKLTDPKNNMPRTYEVLIDRIPSENDLQKIREGTYIGRGENTAPAKIDIIRQDKSSTYLKITLTEGKNREIRRLFESLGKKVKKLKRIQFGPFTLGDIPEGKWKEIAI
jgi:23S rRNA pseudouridine2605 synthase